jgi:two-component system phosphate regulon sensor histidine kinase PhoR
LGSLAAALNEAAPKIHEAVNRLSIELTRREAILAGMTEGVLVVDSRLNITFCNHAFISAIGDHGAAEGLALIKAVRDPGLFEALKEVIDSGATVCKRVHLSVQDGRTFEIRVAPLSSPSSPGAIAILDDLTPGERLDRIRRDFIANVSHEFRTPLATIRGYAETLLDGGLEDRENRRKFVEAIYANSVRLNNIAVDLLTLSEIEGGPPEAEGGPISVGDLVEGAVRAMEPVANLVGVRIHVEELQDCYVRGHRTRLEQAVLNLVDNAIKFNRPNGEVRIRLNTPTENQVQIAVRDTGSGIPREALGRIFERFYRVDKARSRQVGGTGLGLSIVKHAIEQMKGTVKVESQLGVGSTFTVSLPRHTLKTVFLD